MKVLTMQLNSVSVMDIVAYGGAAIEVLWQYRGIWQEESACSPCYVLYCYPVSFYSTSHAWFLLSYRNEWDCRKCENI